MNKNWGYKPLIYEKGEASNLFVVPYRLTLLDADSNNSIMNINSVFTISEVEQELRRIKFNGKVKIYRSFKPKFDIENMGKTELKELSITIEAKLPNQEWERAFTNSLINLHGGQTSLVSFSFQLPIETLLPEQISFKIDLNI